MKSVIDLNNIQEIAVVFSKEDSSPIIRKAGLSKLGDDEVRLKMLTMGFCGRDKSIILGEKTAVEGRIGHEGAGVIIEKGDNVKHLEIGQSVVVYPFINNHNIGYDWQGEGKGIFSNFPAIPSEAVYPIYKSEISEKEWLSYSLIEPFAGVFRGLKRGNIESKDLLIILGAGPIGCEQAILARYLNPLIKIIMIDVSDTKIETVKKKNIPVDYLFTIDLSNKIEKKVFELSKNFKDVLIIHSNPYKESIKQALNIAVDSSTILFFSGIYNWDNDDNQELGFKLEPKRLHYEEYDENVLEIVSYQNKKINTVGSRGFSKKDFDYAAELIINKKITPLSIVTKVLKFDDNILDKLRIESGKNTNIKLLISPYDKYLDLL